MLEVQITKEDLWNYLFNMETIGSGSYGIIKKINDETCVKIYYKDIFDAYINNDISLLDDMIDNLLWVQKEELESSIVDREILENEKKKLMLLSQMGYINKVLYYRGYKIAVEMKLYKDYVQLYDVINKLNKDEIKAIIKKIRNELDKLLSVNIFPNDISSANILVNLKTLDVVYIDLDDICTRYDSDEYFEEKPLVKKCMLDNCNSRLNKIERFLLN